MRRRLLGLAAQRRRLPGPPGRCAHTARSLPSDTPSLFEFMEDQAELPLAPPPPPASLGRSFRVETYGCQMNVSDTQVVARILVDAGYAEAPSSDEADVVLLNTCAIREKAEAKIWGRLSKLRHENNKATAGRARTVGILGCMAERLKERLLNSKDGADLVAGPDAYRDLPRLLSLANAPAHDSPDEQRQAAINVLLSQDETYAEIAPLRTDSNGVTAFVSIMRGCNNMCSYCIVPFTRGRERSRSLSSIVAEVEQLSAEGYKEVTLLGQNVNSYNDKSELRLTAAEREAKESGGRAGRPAPRTLGAAVDLQPEPEPEPEREPEPGRSGGMRGGGGGGGGGDLKLKALSSDGFEEKYRRQEVGIDFAELVDAVSSVDPEMRVRFTSPHPKDFPPHLIDLIATRHNVCNSIHLPSQSGSSAVLEQMRRGYTSDAYLELVSNIRAAIPGIAISTDMISGFCGETEEDHQQTLSLMHRVGYENAFCFAFSTREKTHAHRKLLDDVPLTTKKRRLNEVLAAYREGRDEKNRLELGALHCVLVEGVSKKSDRAWQGRTDTNKTVVFQAAAAAADSAAAAVAADDDLAVAGAEEEEGSAAAAGVAGFSGSSGSVECGPGDYVIVEVEGLHASTLRGRAIERTTLAGSAQAIDAILQERRQRRQKSQPSQPGLSLGAGGAGAAAAL